MKIQDVELLTGLDRATIRFYEKEEILKPKRSENGYRDYTDTDVNLLLKVKLLRKLGVALPAIKNLQEGSTGLFDVLTQQIQVLEQRIHDDTALRVICKRMLEDHAQYGTLDSLFYLQILSTPQENTTFREEVNAEKHPVRRYIARVFDLSLIIALMRAFLIMVIRIRPCSDLFIDAFIPIISYIVSIPVEALWLHLWGTTPGKWLMGMKLEDPNGGKLPFRSALNREVDVLIAGYGFYVPIFVLIRLYISYRSVIRGEGTEWDYKAEIQYQNPPVWKVILTVISFSTILLLNVTAILDAELPKYRSNHLTMEQFTSNYYDYEKSFGNDNTMVLQQDGTWVKRTDFSVEITQIGDPNHERKAFRYTFNENGVLKTISFKDTWEDLGFMPILPDYCYTILYTTVASRPGVTIQDLNKLKRALNSDFGRIMENGGITSGEFTIRDVTFAWRAQLPEREYLYMNDLGGILMNLSDENDVNGQLIPYTLEFVITIG